MNPLRWVALAVAHTVGFVGAIVLGFHSFRYDEIPFVVLAAVATSVLGIATAIVVAARRRPVEAWLVVAAVWLYDALIAGLREPTTATGWGYGLLFGGYAIGALGTYLAYERPAQ